MATVEGIHLVVLGEAMGVVEIGLSGMMTATSVGAQAIGPETALQVAVVVVLLLSLHVQGLVAVVGIALANVIGTLMIDMMEDAMEIGIALTAETVNMPAVIALLVIGIQLAEIVLETGMAVLQIVTLQMDMGKTGAMRGMLHQEVVIGMQVEVLHAMKEEATGVGQLVLMTALAGVAVNLRLTAIKVV